MFCPFCGQAAAANDSSCANCGKPLRSASAANPALIAFTVIFAITTLMASAAAFYYERQVAHFEEASIMREQVPTELPPPPPPPPPGAVRERRLQPCEASVRGGQMGGVIGKILREADAVEVSGTLAQAQLIAQTPPVYPPLAKHARVQGAVVLVVLIDKQGKVANLRVSSGHPMLVQSALDAVRTWRYKPYVLNGGPVEVQTFVTVQFKLAQ